MIVAKLRPAAELQETGVASLGPIPRTWKLERLRFLADLNPSKAELTAQDRQLEATFLPMEAVGEDGSLDASQTRVVADVYQGYTYFRDEDVLVAKITPCFENGKGTVAGGLVNGIGFGTTEFHVLRPRRIDPGLLWYITASERFRVLGESEMKGSAGQKRVPEDFVKDFLVPLPSLPEQRAIAAFLDRETAQIDALIAKKERLIELLQEQRAAAITRAVTKGLDPSVPMKDSEVEWLGEVPAHWAVGRVGDGMSLIQTGPFGSQLHAEEYVSDGIPVINPANIGSGQLTPDPAVSIDESTSCRLKRHLFEEGDIVLARRGEMGRCAVVTADTAGWCCGTGCLLLRASTHRAVPGYLALILASDGVRDWLELESVGSTMANLNSSIVSRIPCPFPPPTEQAAILTAVEEAKGVGTRLTRNVTLAMEHLHEYRTALISAAVTGKIDVRTETE